MDTDCETETPPQKKQISKNAPFGNLKNGTRKYAVVSLTRAGEDRGALPNRLLNDRRLSTMFRV